MLKKLLLASFIIFCVYPLSAQKNNDASNYNPNYLYAPQELQSDFIIMRWVLEKAHPNLYGFTSKAILEKQMDSTFALLNKPMTERDFYQLIAPVFANIHCGHSILDPSYLYQNQGKRFPLDLKFEGYRAFLRFDYTEEKSIPIGSEILKINQLDMSAIINRILPNLAADALHVQGKYQALDDDFQNYYDLLIAQTDTFEIEYLNPQTSQVQKIKIPAQDSDFLRAYDKRYYQTLEKRKSLEFKIFENEQTALLAIHSFLPVDLKYSKQRFSKFIKSVFQQIQKQKIENIIIDLRENSGGEMLYANELFSYLIDKPYRFLNRIEVSSDKKLSQLKNSELSKTAVHNPKHVTETDSGFIVKESYYRFLETQKPQKNNFKGKVYVLIGKKTFSAASLFASLAYTYKRAIFIGEETSGGAFGLNGGDFIDMALQNTNLVMEIPIEKWVRIIPNYPHKNGGIVPHHKIKNSIADELKGEDKVLNFVLELIGQKK